MRSHLSSMARRGLVAALAAGLVVLVPHAAGAAPQGRPASVQGQAALARLGTRLGDVAAKHGWSAGHLRDVLANDRTAWLDPADRVFYAEPAGTATSAAAATTASALTATDVFALHSRPSATRKIFLDVDGNVTTGTLWNNSYGATITSAPFDLDGNPSSWSTTELDRIQTWWQRVSEDYAPFDVDVTTQDPGVDGLVKSSSNDTAYGIRVVISPTNWYSTNAGGVAYVGSFGWGTDTPCFVFTNQLGNGDGKYVAEAASHEAGHTVGLSHDGTSTTAYYSGQGTWAPIMGVGYYKETVQFSKGEYADANNKEDDLSVIQGYTPLRADDYGDTPATAATLTSPDNVAGVITTRTDVDVFRIDAGDGPLSLTVAGATPSPNLDIEARLLDANGATLLTSDPAGTAAAAITTTVTAGTYYLRVDGVGSGDPLTTGYSDYASIGQYTVTGTFPAGTALKVPPVAVATATPTTIQAGQTVTFSGTGSYDPDGGAIASYAWSFAGTTPTSDTAASTTRTFTTAGTYAATLLVTDDEGQTASTSVTVTVNPAPPPSTSMTVASVVVHAGTATKTAAADVVVRDATGTAVAGATVTGTWSGQAKGTSTAVTGADGKATTGNATLRRSGSVTFTVTKVTPPAGSNLVWDGVQKSGSAKL